ncbi:sensor histidine kinase [Thermodesulfobacteriota bacterium]
MQEKLSKVNHLANDPYETFKPGPVSLLLTSVAIIFVAESLVMLLIYHLGLPESFFIGIVDATLLSLFVVPTLYFMLFKPMRVTILKLEKSEEIQNRLEELDMLKSDFISIATHELCTPVTTIMGYTEMLLDQIETEPHKKYLEVIHRKIQSIERLIDDLRIVDRLETGENLQVIPEENDLLTTVRHVSEVYQMHFPEIRLQLELPEEPLILLYDEVRIRQVVDNLLSNAAKYTNDICDRIDVTVVDQDSKALIIIKDEGIGMTEEELRQVYKKFFRAQTEKSAVSGLGLGMAIVKNIVESHKGTIDVVSQKGVGTTVTVALPKMANSQPQMTLACNS